MKMFILFKNFIQNIIRKCLFNKIFQVFLSKNHNNGQNQRWNDQEPNYNQIHGNISHIFKIQKDQKKD